MKIRSGYVSNSSSSSFCILGFIIDEDNIPKEIQEKLDNEEWEISDICYNYNSDQINENDKLKLIDSRTGISRYYDYYLIGAEPETMKDEQTLLEFKNDVLKEIHKLGFTNISLEDLQWYTDGGMDN